MVIQAKLGIYFFCALELFFQWVPVVLADSQVPVASGIRAVPLQSPEGQIYGDKNFKDPGQSGFYRKGNQNITLQIDYISNKIAFLKDRSQSSHDKYSLLNGFCGDEPKTIDAVQRKALDSCIKDYVAVMTFWEAKALAGIGKNNDSVARLQCKSFDTDGYCNSATDGLQFESSSEAEKAKREQMPAFATAKQLAKFAESSPLSRVSDTGDQEWEKKMFEALAPSEDGSEFKQFQKVGTTSGVVEISQDLVLSDRSSDQLRRKSNFDRAELEAAQGVWKKLKERLQKRFPPGTPAPRAADLRRAFIQDFKQDVAAEDRSVQRFLYDQARGENVEFTNISYDRNWKRSGNPDDRPNQGVAANARARKGGGVGEAKKHPEIVEERITITGPSSPNGYLGNEEVIVPKSVGGNRPVGESSVTMSPATRPSFKALSGPDPVSAAQGIDGAADSISSSQPVESVP